MQQKISKFILHNLVDHAMRFAADNMLGKLARWLRILGYDVAYDPALTLRQLVELANREDRILLTRRKKFPDALVATTMFNIASDNFSEQLRRMILQFDLDAEKHLYTRCVSCNTAVQSVEKSSVKGRVPQRTWNGISEFFECPLCRSVYWGGSHRQNTLKKLHTILFYDDQGEQHGTESRRH